MRNFLSRARGEAMNVVAAVVICLSIGFFFVFVNPVLPLRNAWRDHRWGKTSPAVQALSKFLSRAGGEAMIVVAAVVIGLAIGFVFVFVNPVLQLRDAWREQQWHKGSKRAV
jgi:hypothetical protein